MPSGAVMISIVLARILGMDHSSSEARISGTLLVQLIVR